MTALLALLAGTTLAAWPGLLEDFETPKAAILFAGGLALLAGRTAADRDAWPTHASWLDAAIAALVLSTALSTLFSRAPWTSLVGSATQHDGLLTTLALAALYASTRSLLAGGPGSEPRQRRTRLLYLWLALSVFVGLYAFLQVGGLDPVRLEGVPIYGAAGGYRRPSSFLGHANLMGVVTAGGGALAASLLPSARGRRRVFVSAALLVCALATLLSLSRAAWIAMAGGAVVGAAAAMRTRTAARHVAAAAPVVWGLSVLLGAALIAWLLLRDVLVTRLGELVAFGKASGASRMEIWKSAWAAFRAHPLLGIGPDTFEATFRQFQTPAYWRFEWGLIPQHAHSVYLHVLATRGVVGGAALAFVATAFLLALRRAWGHGVAARREAAALLALAVALSLAAAAGAVGIAGAAILAAVAALAASLEEKPGGHAGSPPGEVGAGSSRQPRHRGTRRRPGLRRRAAVLATTGVAIAAAIAMGRDLAASHAAARARTLLRVPSAFAPAFAATRAAARAARLAPYRDRYTLAQARAFVIAAKRDGDRVALAHEALAAARRAASRSPVAAQHHLWRGHAAALLAAMGDSAALAEMEAAYQRARAQAPYDAFALNQMAERWLTVGRSEHALEIARHSARLYPGEAWSLTLQGLALLEMGRRREGRAVLREALDANWRGESRGKKDVESILEQLARADG